MKTPSYEIGCKFNASSIEIEESTIDERISNARKVLRRQIIDLENNAVRDALIKLGWTPPGGNIEWIDVNDIDRLPTIEEPVILHFGNEYDCDYHRQLTARRIMYNDTDWCWSSFQFNHGINDATHWRPLNPPNQGVI